MKAAQEKCGANGKSVKHISTSGRVELYDSGSGQLSWDADGSGRAQAELVAVLGTSGHQPQQLTSNDFFLFS